MQAKLYIFMLRRQPRHKALSGALALDRALRNHRSLQTLVQQASQRGALEQRVLLALPADLRPHFKLASVQEDTIQLQCHSAAYATKLRMQQRAVLQRINARLQTSLRQIKVLIRPAASKNRKTVKPLSLSKENAQTLLQEAGQTKDQALRAILEKLASHAE
ncbi:MAG: DciA family protein [Oleiphilaceae bacterium]|nr:DciA family protein [Oleiphilaceae bacterium]